MTRRLTFFFSSRRRHTRLQGDWSADVCSSDLLCQRGARCQVHTQPDEKQELAHQATPEPRLRSTSSCDPPRCTEQAEASLTPCKKPRTQDGPDDERAKNNPNRGIR